MSSADPIQFITNAFPIIVGALASEDAEYLCQKNELSFVELIRPFCKLDSDTQIHDPVNPSIVIPARNLTIRVVDIQHPSPPPVLVNRILNEVVGRTVLSAGLDSALALDDPTHGVTPWFEAYRDCFFQLLQPMNHEFIRDIMACIFVVSSKHPDPMAAFNALITRQNSIQNSTNKPKSSFNWFSTTPFKYYLLLHDSAEVEDGKAEIMYNNMKSAYGTHSCSLLHINSRQKSHQSTNENHTDFSDIWSPYIYSFSDETLDIDESELEVDKTEKSQMVSQTDADKKEEAIINELENIDRQIQQNPESPGSLTFKDPLTGLHYNDTLEESDYLGPLAQNKETSPPVGKTYSTRKISERTVKLTEYRKSLHQLSFTKNFSMLQSKKGRGFCLDSSDQQKIKVFIQEFVSSGLLPSIEGMMRSLSELILARRGLHKSIFHATKKWFGGNKASGGGTGAGFSAGANYDNDSAELQYRKLGDLAFLVQHYDLAYNSYHSAKREFNNDHAWMYFAGALEMAAISAFMQGTVRVYPVHYFEACISTYFDTCRVVEFATRACLFSTELLRFQEMYRESAVELIKLTNEDSDLRSALFLEQAAHCYMKHKPSMIRKYAFHMILAGHRYSKAGQRKHTLRCYINALQVYSGREWHLAEDHVNFTIGRQSFNLGNLNDSQLALKSLLLHESGQPVSQQASYLREFLAVFKQNLVSLQTKGSSISIDQESLQLPLLPLPHLNANLTRCLPYIKEQNDFPRSGSPMALSHKRTRTVNVGSHSFQRNFSKAAFKRWADLERKVVKFVYGSAPYPFKPTFPCLSKDTDNKECPIIAVGELFSYEVHFANPLKIPLNLLKLSLLWEFTSKDDPSETVTNRITDDTEHVWTEEISNLQLNASETKAVPLKVRANYSGNLNILGIRYTLSSLAVTCSADDYGKIELTTSQENALNTVGVTGMQLFNIQGPRLNSSKQERARVSYGVDKRLQPLIVPALPLLEVKMIDLPVTLLCGEVQRSQFSLKNIGRIGLKNLHIICNRSEYFSFVLNENDNIDTFSKLSELRQKENPDDYVDNGIIKIPLENESLAPDGEIVVPVYVYGMGSPGVHEINFLFYYEPDPSVKQVPYRLVQQMIRLQTLNSLTLSGDIRITKQRNNAEECKRIDPELLLSLTVENHAQTGPNVRCVEFDLKRVTCFSRKWELRSLVDLSQETFKLRPGELCSLYLKSKSILKKDEDTVKEEDIVKSCDIHLFDDEMFTPGQESLDLFLKPGDNISAILNCLGLIVYWETFFIDEGFTRVVIKGQSHFTVKDGSFNNTISNNNPSPTSSITRGININYVYPSSVDHDFSSVRLCVVEIIVQCSNATDRDVIIEIEAVDDIHEENADAEYHLEKQSIIQWVGQRQISIRVPAHSSEQLPMNAMFSSVGMYEILNLNAYVDNYTDGGLLEKVSLLLPTSPMICVHEKNSKST